PGAERGTERLGPLLQVEGSSKIARAALGIGLHHAAEAHHEALGHRDSTLADPDLLFQRRELVVDLRIALLALAAAAALERGEPRLEILRRRAGAAQRLLDLAVGLDLGGGAVDLLLHPPELGERAAARALRAELLGPAARPRLLELRGE